MNIAFRVDSSTQIGTGHIMRCLTLADALSQRNVAVRFLSQHMPQHFRNLLIRRGYEFADLGVGAAADSLDELPHAQWLGTTQAADAAAAVRALSDKAWDWLIVDNYALDIRWESALRRSARKIASIDDIANRHDCDVLLDPNFYSDMAGRYDGKVPSHCQMLLGPRFAPLRQEFRQLREQVKPRTGSVERILIFFGGMDAANYTGTAIKALADMGITDVRIDVVIGETHPARQHLESECLRLGLSLHVQTDRMAELMAAADLAVGAGGTATWERCCLGLPALAICVAENQDRQIADAAREGLVYAPDTQREPGAIIARHVRALIDNSALRFALSRRGMEAVDGCGVSRVVGSLGCTGIRLRQAVIDDSRNVFEWRNHPVVRGASRARDIISWATHENWFAAVLGSPDRILLIGEREESAVGVVRFDLCDDEAEISIYLVPGVQSRGEGRELLLAAESWVAVNQPSVAQIRAYVLGGNQPSHRLFLGANYRVESTCYLKRLH